MHLHLIGELLDNYHCAVPTHKGTVRWASGSGHHLVFVLGPMDLILPCVQHYAKEEFVPSKWCYSTDLSFCPDLQKN